MATAGEEIVLRSGRVVGGDTMESPPAERGDIIGFASAGVDILPDGDVATTQHEESYHPPAEAADDLGDGDGNGNAMQNQNQNHFHQEEDGTRPDAESYHPPAEAADDLGDGDGNGNAMQNQNQNHFHQEEDGTGPDAEFNHPPAEHADDLGDGDGNGNAMQNQNQNHFPEPELNQLLKKVLVGLLTTKPQDGNREVQLKNQTADGNQNRRLQFQARNPEGRRFRQDLRRDPEERRRHGDQDLRRDPEERRLHGNQDLRRDPEERRPKQTPRKEMKPPLFDGTTPWMEYLLQFQMISKYNNWNEKQMAINLATSLRDDARSVLVDLDDAGREHYPSLLGKLNQRFGPQNQTQMFRAILRTRKRQPKEGLPTLAHEIRKLVKLAYPEGTHYLLEEISTDSFINALPEAEYRWQIQQSRPKTLDDAVQTAVELEAFKMAEMHEHGSSKKMVRVAQTEAPKEPQDQLENRNNLEDILVTLSRQMEALNRRQNENRHRGDIICYGCGKPGHIRRNCRSSGAGNRHGSSQNSGN